MFLITERKPYGYGRPKARYSRETWMKVKSPVPIRSGRKSQGYSQRDLAALCRCTQAAISALETGKMAQCSDDLARTICHWIKRDLEEVFETPEETRAPSVTIGSRTDSPRGSRRTVAA